MELDEHLDFFIEVVILPSGHRDDAPAPYDGRFGVLAFAIAGSFPSPHRRQFPVDGLDVERLRVKTAANPLHHLLV